MHRSWREGELVAAEALLRWEHHFEQNFHVRHRLETTARGVAWNFETDGLHKIALEIALEISSTVAYRPVATDGAARSAALIADLL